MLPNPDGELPGLARRRLTKNILKLTDALARDAAELRQAHGKIAELKADLAAVQKRITNQDRPVEASLRAGLKRGRAVVVTWDAGHNPVGRAYVLSELLQDSWDVEVIGPSWTRYGDGLWEPLRGLDLQMRLFRCRDLSDFLPQAVLEATRRTHDLVYVGKPRLPSLLIGLMIKEHSGCPLILDIDDFELSFFKNETAATLAELEAAGLSALREPYEELATRFCEGLVGCADAITVSNVALQQKYGGHIVRHARDETTFRPDAYDRLATRRELGIADDEFALVFVGTPRPHKGIYDVARALHELDDPSFSFHIVGTVTDRRVEAELRKYRRARIRLHPNCSFADLPRLLSAADAVPLLQDPRHPISAYQIPAKISDATSLGTPVLMTDVPPVRDLAHGAGIIIVTPENLGPTLRRLRAERRAEDKTRVREFFLGELGNRVNRVRLDLAIAAAEAARKPLPDDYERLMSFVIDGYGEMLRSEQGDPLRVPPRPSAKRGGAPLIDVALFWKQNDTGLYGRRSDMIAKYLLKSGRIGRVMLFDAPMPATDLYRLNQSATLGTADQGPLVLRNTLARWKGKLDSERLLERVFIHRAGDHHSLLGSRLPDEAEYLDFVRSHLAQAGFDLDRTIAWACPVVWHFPSIVDSISFRAVVADLIDDQRAWPAKPKYLERLDRNYRETLARADVVFTNCEPVADAFKDYAPRIHVVPNGAERVDLLGALDPPRDLAGLTRPIIGYVGNLRDRIDWDLLSSIAASRPHWTLVLAGSAHDNPNALELGKFANVRFLGVVPYHQLFAHLRAFDVAIVPHLTNRITERMNPLKVYNYFAAGLPIVSTEVPNVIELRRFMEIATGADEFIARIEQVLNRAPSEASAEHERLLRQISWEARVKDILGVLDRFLAAASEPAGALVREAAQ